MTTKSIPTIKPLKTIIVNGKRLCPVCRADVDAWQESFNEVHNCRTEWRRGD